MKNGDSVVIKLVLILLFTNYFLDKYILKCIIFSWIVLINHQLYLLAIDMLDGILTIIKLTNKEINEELIFHLNFK